MSGVKATSLPVSSDGPAQTCAGWIVSTLRWTQGQLVVPSSGLEAKAMGLDVEDAGPTTVSGAATVVPPMEAGAEPAAWPPSAGSSAIEFAAGLSGDGRVPSGLMFGALVGAGPGRTKPSGIALG